MDNILEILHEIEAAKGSAKNKVLEKHKENVVLKEFWQFTYGRINLHTRKMIPLENGADSNPESYGEVVSLLDKLRCKVVSGNAQEQLIAETLSMLHPNCIEVFNRVIKGNLRCGIGATVANKIWGKDFLKKYPVMLISPYCPKKAAKIMEGGAVLQLKSDGVRGICEISQIGGNRVIGFFSRQGEQFFGLEKIFDDQVKFLAREMYWLNGEDFCLDGEFIVIENGKHNPSKASGIMNKAIQGTASDEELESLVYIVWDVYVPSDPDAEYYKDRLEDLKDGLSDSAPKNIILAETWPVKNLEQVATKYQEIVDAGNEGVVLKSLKNTWSDTRVTDCIKYKEKHQAEFKIVSHYLGEEGKEFQKVLGGFVVQSECGKVVTKTGSGLTFEDRGILSGGLDKRGKPIYLKDDDGNYIKNSDFSYEDYYGQIVTIEYNKRTKTKGDRETYSLRFPIVKQFRFDKNTANTLEHMVDQEGLSRGLRL